MALAQDAAAPRKPRSGRPAEDALVHAVGRIPLPLGAKLLIGFAVVGVLLAIG